MTMLIGISERPLMEGFLREQLFLKEGAYTWKDIDDRVKILIFTIDLEILGGLIENK